MGRVQDLLRHVLPDADLHGGLGVAEEVVGGAHARGDIRPAWHAGDLVVVTRGNEGAGIEMLGRDVRVLVIEPEAAAQRKPLQRPLILHVGAHEGLHVLVEQQRIGIQRHAVRDAVQQLILDGRALLAELLGPAANLHPDLEGVRAGHVRHRGARVLNEVVLPAQSAGARGVRRRAEEPDVAVLLERGDGEEVGLRLRPRPVAEPLGCRPRLDEQPVRRRERPGDGRNLRVIGPDGGSLRGQRRRHAPVAVAPVLPVIRDLELVPLGDLPRSAAGGLPLVEVVDRGSGPVRCVQERVAAAQIADEPAVLHQERRARRLRVEAVDHRPLAAPRTLGGEKPQLVPHDRSAERAVHIPDLLDDRQIGLVHAPGDEIVAETRRALHAGAGVVADEGDMERVRARLRNVVDVDAVGRRLAHAVAQLDGHFAGGRRVRHEDASAPVVGLESVDERLVVAVPAAVDPELDVGLALAAADVLAGRAHRDPRREGRKRFERLVRGNRVEHLTRNLVPGRGVLHVHDRALSRHRHCFLEGADSEVGVHRRGEGSRQLHAVTLEGAEAGQREGHAVHAGDQSHDPVLSLFVGHDAAHFLDERRARRLDGHAGQHAARRISHNPDKPGGAALRARADRHRQRKRGDDQPNHSSTSVHDPSSKRFPLATSSAPGAARALELSSCEKQPREVAAS